MSFVGQVGDHDGPLTYSIALINSEWVIVRSSKDDTTEVFVDSSETFATEELAQISLYNDGQRVIQMNVNTEKKKNGENRETAAIDLELAGFTPPVDP